MAFAIRLRTPLAPASSPLNGTIFPSIPLPHCIYTLYSSGPKLNGKCHFKFPFLFGIPPLSRYNFQIKWTFLGSFENFLLSKHISRSSRLFLDYQETFSRISRHFLNRQETFQFIQTLFRSSRHFSVHPDTYVDIILFAYYLDTLYSIRTFSKLSGNSSAKNELVAKTFRICKNFPGFF